MAIRRHNEIIVDLNNRNIEALYLEQGESEGTIIPFRVIQNGMAVDLTNYEVNFVGRKSDGTSLLNPCTLTDPKAGKAEYVVTDQTVSTSGKLKAAIQFIKEGTIAYSRELYIIVEATPLGGVQASDQMIYLVKAINEYDKYVEGAADNAKKIEAIIATVRQDLTPKIKDGNWYIGDTDTGQVAQGPKGDSGLSGDITGIKILEQTEYDGLETKESKTIYLTKEL